MTNNKMNVKNWKWFKVKEIFQNNLSVYKYSAEPEEKGNLPFITSTSLNNGVNSFVNEKFSFNKKCLTISTNGQCFDVFLQDYGKFCISSDVEILYNPNLTSNQYLFIATVLKKERYRWGFGRKPKNNKVFETKIKLPVDENGDPDWKYMEEYMKILREKEREDSELAQSKKINKNQFRNSSITHWKDFFLYELFDFQKGKCSNAPELEEGNEVPYIGAKKTENGVMKYVKRDENLISKGNCISFICQGEGSNGYNNYFDIDTIQSTSNVLGYNSNLNTNNALFLVTLLDLERPKWSFGRGRSPKLKNTKIKLPVDKNGDPDWKYMEEYIKSLPYSKYL